MFRWLLKREARSSVGNSQGRDDSGRRDEMAQERWVVSVTSCQWNYRYRCALPNDSVAGGKNMHLSRQGLQVMIFVGIIAGMLAGRVMGGGGFGLIGALPVGQVGAFIGDGF